MFVEYRSGLYPVFFSHFNIHILFSVLNCSPIPVWMNMNVSTTATRWQTELEYTCAEGYIFDSNDKNDNDTRSAVCNDDALWEPELVTCKCEWEGA